MNRHRIEREKSKIVADNQAFLAGRPPVEAVYPKVIEALDRAR
jgi:hypothetical protein